MMPKPAVPEHEAAMVEISGVRENEKLPSIEPPKPLERPPMPGAGAPIGNQNGRKPRKTKLTEGEMEGILDDMAMGIEKASIKDKWNVTNGHLMILEKNNKLSLESAKDGLIDRQLTIALAAQDVVLEKMSENSSFQAAVIAKMSIQSALEVKNGLHAPGIHINFNDTDFAEKLLKQLPGEDV